MTAVEALVPATFVVLCCEARMTGMATPKRADRMSPALDHFNSVASMVRMAALRSAPSRMRSGARAGWEPLVGLAGFRNFEEMISMSPGGLKPSSSEEPAMNSPGYFDPSEPPNRP